MKRRVFLGLVGAMAIAFPTLSAAREDNRAQVVVVPALHGLHASVEGYSYETLYDLVAAHQPDFVGVEIRQADLSQPDSYLSRNYPREMLELARKYSDHAFGFDWLGDDVPPAPVPEDFWPKQSIVKQLEREMGAGLEATEANAAIRARRSEISQQQDTILRSATPRSMTDGVYDTITAERYVLLGKLVEGTRFEQLSRFYMQRDAMIAQNVIAFAEANPGKRIVVVTGADHQGPLLVALNARPDTIKVIPALQTGSAP